MSKDESKPDGAGELPAEPSADQISEGPAGPLLWETEAETPGDLEAGLERSRGGFMSRLRGLLKGGPAEADWGSV